MATTSPDFYFDPLGSLTVEISNRALKMYSDGFEKAKNLEGDLPIILDTNILLGYYGMSQIEKKKLIDFISTYNDRIYITKQVEQEYLKNRVSTIKKDFFTPLRNIAEDYVILRSEILGKIQGFRENKKKILSQDYPTLWEGMKGIEDEIKAIISNEQFLENIKEQVSTTTQNNKNLAYSDDLLDIVANFKFTELLTESELDIVKQNFENFLLEFKNAKESIKWKYSIPGCGDKKDDASGDFIIFHEILKFMKLNNKSCIFLTNDVTKGDWLQSDRNAHNHYLEQAYSKTGQIIFIVHAEETLPNISFENIHKSAKIEIVDDEVAVESPLFESSIVTIDIAKGYGFILANNDNLYFNYAGFEGNFSDLRKNDVVVFEKGFNSDGKTIAKNVRKVAYSFEDQNSQISSERISHINHNRGIGFITNQPENLYFHQAFLTEPDNFELLKIGDEVEFIVGCNSEGEKIARLVRPVIINKMEL